MDNEKLVEAICAARFSEIPGHWADGLTPGIIEIERMKAERILPIIAREVAAETERCARVADGFHIYWTSASPRIAAAIRENTNAKG